MAEDRVVARYNCLVCQAPSYMYYYGVQICRGCACFYKRWFNDRRKYECKGGSNTCKVRHSDPLSVRCKACRIGYCLKLGLPGGDNSPVESRIKHFEKGITAVYTLLVKACNNLHEFQATQIHSIHSDVDFKSQKLIEPNKHEITNMTVLSIPVFFDILCNSINPLNLADNSDKTRLIQQTQYELHLVNEFCLTSHYFPQIGDTRCSLMPGYAVDMYDTIDDFWFEDGIEFENREQCLKIVYSFNEKYLQIADQFKRLKLGVMETSLLMLLIVCKHCALTKNMGKFFDRIMAEFGDHLRSKHGDEGLVRLAEILLVYDKITKFTIECSNMHEQFGILRATGEKVANFLPCMQDLAAVSGHGPPVNP